MAFWSDFSGAAFCLAKPIGGLLVELPELLALSVNVLDDERQPTDIAAIGGNIILASSPKSFTSHTI